MWIEYNSKYIIILSDTLSASRALCVGGNYHLFLNINLKKNGSTEFINKFINPNRKIKFNCVNK